MLRTAIAAVAILFAAGTALACEASYYGSAHHGRTMANGRPFNMHAMTAAHRTYPFGTRLKVTYRGRSVVVTVTDRGPYAGGRCIDLSYGAAKALGMIRAGVGNVTITRQ